MGTIVVVDSPDAGEDSLATQLRSAGHHVVGAMTGSEALAAEWAEPTAAFVRTSAHSPRGLTQVCQLLKRDPRLERVPLIACGVDVSQAEQAFAGGADDFCRFPGDARELGLRATSAEARPVPVARRQQPILVVDDDVFFRRSFADLLTREGYQTIEAGSGPEALELLERHNPALAIVDLFMPGLGGLELVQRLRSTPRWQRLPVVAISGVRSSTEKGLVAALERLEVHDFVEKRGPSLDSLAAVVDDILRSDPARSRLPRVSSQLLGEFRPAPDEPRISAYVSDLGVGGAFLRTLVVLEPQSMIHFRLDWGNGRPWMVCMARVVWSRARSSSGGVVGMGIEFAEVGASDRETLRSFVYS